MRFVVALFTFSCACTSAPLVLIEVPNTPSGHRFVERAAEHAGCTVTARGEPGLFIRCDDGTMHVPTFAGPPTLAVRCLEGRLADFTACRARMRGLLLGADAAAQGSPPN